MRTALVSTSLLTHVHREALFPFFLFEKFHLQQALSIASGFRQFPIFSLLSEYAVID